MQVFVDLSNRVLRRFECYFFILLMLTAAAAAAQPTTVYEVLNISSLNRFQDNVLAIAVNGNYPRSFTLGTGTVKKAGDKFRQTAPAAGGDYWMIVAKSSLTPGATAGQFTVSIVDTWYNNKPAIKGLNNTQWGATRIELFNRIKLGDLIRWMPNANPRQRGYWKLNSELTEKEKLLVSEINNLPHLREAGIITLGPSSDLFNCYAYAANFEDPESIGWVAGKEGFPPGAKKHVVLNKPEDLISFYRGQGWVVVADGEEMPPIPESGLIAVYRNNQGYPTHAALVTPTGIYAKMGRLGTFQFASLKQMSGGAFGTPDLWLGRIP